MIERSIIQTKLIPPQLKETCIVRPALMKKLANMKTYPLTIIHSGPGYGKSTALASFLKGENTKNCWYTISKQDDNFLPFLSHMIYSIRTLIPDFGSSILQELGQEAFQYYDENIDFLCATFINELSKYEEEFLFIVDDFHLIEHSDAITKWMQMFINYKPQNLHFVISGRIRPSWHILETMKVKGDILEITEKDLSFSKEEIDVLFSDYYRLPIDLEMVGQIYEMTEGWIIAVQMIWQQMKTEPHYSFLKIKSVSMDELFRFLAMEVFSKQPESVRDFLERTCVFEEFSESICNLWFSQAYTRRILEHLMKQNLFIMPIGEGQYRYHSLFKEFLQSQFSQKIEVYHHTHRKAANYYLYIQDYEKALFHLLEIKNDERTAEILQKYGMTLLEDGKMETLLKVIDIIPESIKNKYYMIWFYEGEIYRYRCHYEKAIRCYRKVEKLAEKDQDKLRMSLGVEGQARVYLDTVQPIKADPLLRKSVSLLKSSTTNSQEREMSLYLLVAENLLNMGNALDAEDWYLQSQSMGISSKYELKMVELKARLYLRTGRLKQAKEVVKKYREKHEYHASLSSAHRTVDILLSVISAYMGEAEEAKKFAQSGILQGAKWKAPFVEACGWMRIGHAVQLNPSYEKEMSVKCYETAMSIMDEIHISRGKAEAWMGLCLLYGKKGFYDLALECGKKALTETEKAKDAWLSSYIRLSLGIAAYYHDDNEEAEHYFQQCYRLFQSCHCQYGLMLACFWLSLIAFQEKKEKSFGFFFQQWLQHVHEQNYHFFIERKILFGPNDSRKMIPMLIKAKNEGIEIHLANQLLEWLGMKDISFHPGYTLKVQTLGDFKVFLGEKEVKGGEWKREKAKELFQLLITFRDRLLLRNTILSLLWGENDELTAERDFKVALNALNKVIEPNRKARSDPYFIERRGLSYGLNSNANIEIDKVEFQKLTEKGLNVKDRNQAIDILNKALTLYKGDYLPDRAYDDWCLEERERLQLLFLRGAERLAQLNVEKEQFDETIHWCSQILAIDSCWEEAYRLLMYCYYRKNNRAYAVKLYEKCRNQLQKELGVEPLESTKQMLKMIKEVNFIT